MNKTTKIILAILIIVLIISAIAIAVPLLKKDKTTGKTNLGEISNAEKLEEIIEKVYEDVNEELLPSLETTAIDLNDFSIVNTLTGLENGENLEYLVISQPLMTSQAYSFVLAKVKEGVNANSVAKEMSENVDMRRWICVEAEQLYATNSGNVVCLIMGSKDTAKAVYDSFKKQAGNVGEKYEKESEVIVLPPERLDF